MQGRKEHANRVLVTQVQPDMRCPRQQVFLARRSEFSLNVRDGIQLCKVLGGQECIWLGFVEVVAFGYESCERRGCGVGAFSDK